MNLALQDPLIGSPNRRQFDGALRVALRTVPTVPEVHTVFMFDLSPFKNVNDIHGHSIGDQVLNVFGRPLRAVSASDVVAQLRGRELAILATSIALRIIESLLAPIVVDGVRHQVGTAIGVAISPHRWIGMTTELPPRLATTEACDRMATGVAEGNLAFER